MARRLLWIFALYATLAFASGTIGPLATRSKEPSKNKLVELIRWPTEIGLKVITKLERISVKTLSLFILPLKPIKLSYLLLRITNPVTQMINRGILHIIQNPIILEWSMNSALDLVMTFPAKLGCALKFLSNNYKGVKCFACLPPVPKREKDIFQMIGASMKNKLGCFYSETLFNAWVHKEGGPIPIFTLFDGFVDCKNGRRNRHNCKSLTDKSLIVTTIATVNNIAALGVELLRASSKLVVMGAFGFVTRWKILSDKNSCMNQIYPQYTK